MSPSSGASSTTPTTAGPFSTFASRFLLSPRTQQQFTTPTISPRSTSLDSARRRAEIVSHSDKDSYSDAEELTPTSPGMSSYKAVKVVVDEARSERSVRSTETASDNEMLSRNSIVNSDNVPPASAPPNVQSLPRPYNVVRSSTLKSPDSLYPTIPNLPRTFIGSKHNYRAADGGYNNVLHPDVGRAGMPYTRNVRSEHRFSTLPEPGLVFDTMLKARDKRVHPSGASSLAYAFAQLIAFSLYDTNFDDSDINSTSSYLDLSPLYGSDETTQSQIRDKESRRGLLFPDAFAEDRLALAPPTVCALLVIFSRNHNYIAERLFSINEQKKWIDPSQLTDEKLKTKQDEEIFQTARLVNCGHFLSVMVSDYLPAFLGLYEDGNWTKKGGYDLSQIRKRAANEHQHGTHSSVEFNMVYRWHAALSQADLKWTEDAFNELVKRKSFDRVTAHELKCVTWQHRSLSAEPKRRGFGNLIRGFEGRFDDDELAGVLLEATENVAGAFRPRGVPHVFRAAEMLAIDEARVWGACSMNEFREFLGLKPFTSFEQWCSDPVISGIARRLYGHIDNLELYPGLQCETSNSTSSYSCGYTMAKAILADAWRIVKGDRFSTTDFTPRNLTAWGYQDCQKNMSNSNQGGQLSRLLMRHLHRHYPYNSVYGCFPFLTPLKVKDNLTKQGIADRYTFERPSPAPVPKVLDDFVAIRHVVNNPDTFPPLWELKVIQDGAEYMLSVEPGTEYRTPEKLSTLEVLFPNPGMLQFYGEWLRESISKKTKERSWKYAGIKGTTVDIVKDVINATVIEWVAEFVLGIPLKTDAYPEGLYTESELYGILSNLYSIKYPGIEESEHTFALRQSVRTSHVILSLVAKEILALKRNLLPRAFVERITGQKRTEEDVKPSFELFDALASSNKPMDEALAIVLDIAISFSINVAESVAHAVEFYLDEDQEKERHHIVELLQLDDAESGEVLLGYAREALRFHPRICNMWRGVTTDTQIPQGQEDLSPLNVRVGDRLWISFKNAYVDAAQFPEPYEIDPRRTRKDYRIHGSEFFSGPIAAFGEQLIVEVLRVILKLRNLRLADGDVGRMAGFRTLLNETEMNVYLTPDGSTSCRPGPFHIVCKFDE